MSRDEKEVVYDRVTLRIDKNKKQSKQRQDAKVVEEPKQKSTTIDLCESPSSYESSLDLIYVATMDDIIDEYDTKFACASREALPIPLSHLMQQSERDLPRNENAALGAKQDSFLRDAAQKMRWYNTWQRLQSNLRMHCCQHPLNPRISWNLLHTL